MGISSHVIRSEVDSVILELRKAEKKDERKRFLVTLTKPC